MSDHERMFSAISGYVSKLGLVELDNDVRGGTMTVLFKSPFPSEGPLVALKIHGTRNVEIDVAALPDWKSFRRVARIYSDALALIDCFQLIEVEPVDPDESQSGRGLRIAGRMSR
jgi:hypothetical protein